MGRAIRTLSANLRATDIRHIGETIIIMIKLKKKMVDARRLLYEWKFA